MFHSVRCFVSIYGDQIRDVFEHFGAVPHFDYTEIGSTCGGNPVHKYHLSIDWRLPMREVDFVYSPITETVQEFFNRIRAYCFDCVDTFCNL